jgi:hypothetical protein
MILQNVGKHPMTVSNARWLKSWCYSCVPFCLGSHYRLH